MKSTIFTTAFYDGTTSPRAQSNRWRVLFFFLTHGCHNMSDKLGGDILNKEMHYPTMWECMETSPAGVLEGRCRRSIIQPSVSAVHSQHNHQACVMSKPLWVGEQGGFLFKYLDFIAELFLSGKKGIYKLQGSNLFTFSFCLAELCTSICQISLRSCSKWTQLLTDLFTIRASDDLGYSAGDQTHVKATHLVQELVVQLVAVVKDVFVRGVAARFDAVLHHHAGLWWTLELLDLGAHKYADVNIINASLKEETAVSLILKYLTQLRNVWNVFL